MKGATILLVEDEAIIAMNERLLLEAEGYSVRVALTGPGALEAFDGAVDLVLMDIDLGGGMGGPEAARLMFERREVPLVFLSSHTEPEVVRMTEEITSYGYIVKSAGGTVLLAAVKMAFRLWEARRELAARERSYRMMFHSNPNPMWVYELSTLEFLEVNDAAVAMYGWSRDQFLRMKISDIRPREDVERLLENVRHVTSGLDRAGRWRHVTKDGTLREVEIVSHTIDWMGKKAEVVLVL